jgi:hypothetical protein
MPSSLSLKVVLLPARPEPAESTAAAELAKLTGAHVTSAGAGVSVALASRGLPEKFTSRAKDSNAWMWLRIADDGTGEICATHGSFLFAAVRLLAAKLGELTREKLAAGVWLPASFGWHRPHWDACFTQYWRSARNFDPERYVAALAETGFTHCEVNGLQSHMPYEDMVAWEYYPQFYTYAPGFNHFVDTELTRGVWPAHYLDANLAHLVKLAGLGRKYGLKPGVCMFEPRTLPERFFAKFPTLRGARVDHPFRSRLPRYTMAQDHPIVQRHFREALQKLMRSVPDLSYMSVWTNDSGAGFEHTASLYVGRNGGPYMIREWRNHEKIAQAAGQSIGRFLRNLRTAGAEINPDFDVILRIEPFKVEQDYIKSELGGHVTWEGPSLLVRGYHVPYAHPRYPENQAVAGTLFHTTMDASERETLAQSRAQGVNPVLHYSASSVMNHEPLLGIPYPHLLHQKLTAVRDAGLDRLSCLGGLTNPERAPYWPNPAILRAVQFFPEKPVGEVLNEFASGVVGPARASSLVAAWKDFENALISQPMVGLYSAFGFCWQRTWDRPFVPDIEAVPAADRDYYERHGCFQNNNPGLNDLGKDVLFDLITRESGAKMATDMDREVLPKIQALIARLASLANPPQIQAPGAPRSNSAEDARAAKVFSDLHDRVRAYRHWVTSLRNVCAWCECVYGYIDAKDDATRDACEQKLQTAIDLELENARGLLQLLETTPHEVLVISGAGNNTFLYGEDLVANIRTKIALTEKYRHHKPRIDRDIYWRPIPGTQWPEGWSASTE